MLQNKLKRLAYFSSLITVATLIFFFSFKQQPGIGESDLFSEMDLRPVKEAAIAKDIIVPDQLNWDELEHQHSADSIYYYVSRYRTGLKRHKRQRLAKLIVSQSRRYNFNPYFIAALIQVESSFKNYAVSPAKAYGLMQVRPFVGRALAKELGLRWRGKNTLFNPFFNVRAGIYYLAKLRDRFAGNLQPMITAYNYGPTRINYRQRHELTLPKVYYQKMAKAMKIVENKVAQREFKKLRADNWSI